MKAIETKYKGYRFRSRLEARWAIFFDSLGQRWDYELEGFEFENGVKYLPDFKIYWSSEGNDGYWIEVKGAKPNKDEIEKADLLRKETNTPVFIYWGSPWPDEWKIVVIAKDGKVIDAYFDEKDCVFRREDDHYASSTTPFSFHFQVLPTRIKQNKFQCAFDDARGARFEHGEQVYI